MSKITQYGPLSVPAANGVLPIVDVNDTTMAASGTTKKITTANLLQSAETAIGRVFIAGHSYAAGFQNTEGAERWATRLAASLHAEEVTYAVTQAVLARDSGGTQPGGYANVLNGLTPRTAGASTYSPRNSAPYLPLSPVNVFFYGFNDLAFLGAVTATNVAWFKMALRGITCIARAGGYFPDTSSSVAYGGSGGTHWTANTNVATFGSPTNHSTTTVNDTVTITVPADFPGGEIDLLTLAYQGGTKWSVVVDGGAAQVLDGTGSAFGSATGHSNLVVQRLTGLSAGTHTIVATVAAIDGGATAYFDSWLIAAPVLPLTVLCTQPAAPSLPLAVGGATHTPVTASDVSALNTAITALPAEFANGMVVIADVAAYFANAGGNVASGQPGSLYASDNLHPNSAGHGVIAQCVWDAIRSAPSPGAARMAPLGLVMRQLSAPLEPALSANWSVPGGGWAYFTKDRSGRVTVNAKLVRTGTPAAGETIFTVPPGYNPEQGTFSASCVAWAAAFASAASGIVNITTGGAVQWYSGTTSTEFDICASWFAGGQGS